MDRKETKETNQESFFFLRITSFAFTELEMMVIFYKWVNDDVIKLTKVNKQPTREDKENPKFYRYHRCVHHPTADCQTFLLNRKNQD